MKKLSDIKNSSNLSKLDIQDDALLEIAPKDLTKYLQIANKFISDDDFMSKLEELMNISGIPVKDNAVSEFVNLVHIRNKVNELLPYFSKEV